MKSSSTTYRERFVDAVTLLCGGKVPPNFAIDAWIAGKDDASLQKFAIRHGPAWCQGIVLLDAAAVIAETPEEGGGHEMREDVVETLRCDAIDSDLMVTFEPGQACPVW